MQNKYITDGNRKSQIFFRTVLIGFIASLGLLFSQKANGQVAAYTCEAFNANIPGYPNWTVGTGFKTPTVDWTEAKITGGGVAPNDWEWVNAGANPVVANQNIAGFPTGLGFVRYINRTVAYPALSGAPTGDAAFIATRSLDWSGHTVHNALLDTFGLSIWRDNTAACAGVLDSVVVYVNTTPSLSGATKLNEFNTGASKILRSTTQAPVVAVAGWYRYQYLIPNELRFVSPTGGTSNAYIIIAGYSLGGNNIFIDNINMPQWQTPMVVTSAAVFLTQSADVGKNTTDNLMMGLQITTKGSLLPKKLDGILFNTTGSTAFTTDVVQPAGAKCWFTGGSSSFATNLPAGTNAVSVPKVNPSAPTYNNATLFFGSLDGLSGCPTLPLTGPAFYPGSENYVWLAYDITAGAIPGHYVAAGFEQLFTSWSAPGCFNDTIITSAGIQTPANFAAFTPSPSVSAVRQIDQAYNIPTYTAGTSWPGGGYYNNDFVSGVQIFGDNSTSIDNYIHDQICNSCVLVGGQNCQRFSCHPPDYTQFKPQNVGTYMNRGPLQVTQGRGVRNGTAPYILKAQCGTWFSANTIGVFIDWNKDGDFDDRYGTGVGVNAYIYENYGSQQQVQSNMTLPVAVWGANTSWTINVPAPADVVTDLNQGQPCVTCTQDVGPIIVGNVRMRVREIYAAPNSPAGTIGVHPTNSGYTWGEVEDYTVQVLPDCPVIGSNVCKWVGASNDWNDPQNWCPAIPTKNDVAYIAPGPQNMPSILDNTVAECRNLRIMPGANLNINATKGSSLKVYDDVEIGAGAALGAGSSIAVTSDFNATLTIPGKSSVPPAGLALVPQTPFRTNAQAKTQIAYTAVELANTYGWKAGDIIDQIGIEVNSISGGAAASTYSGLRIRAFLTTAPVVFPFPATPSTKIAVEAGDANVVATWPRIIYGPASTVLNMPLATGGTQALGNYYTFNLIPNTLIWDGVSNLVLSFENWTSVGLAPAKNYILYDEPSPTFATLSLNYGTVTAGPITGYAIDGAGHYSGGLNAGISATVSNQRPRLDFKWHRPYNQFPITVCGDWYNNNRNVRTQPYSTTPVYGIPGDSGFIASNSTVTFDPTGRSTVNSPGLAFANLSYYPGVPGVLLPTDVDQDITSAATGGGNSTVFQVLEIKKASATNKAVRQVSTFNPYLIGNYADTLELTTGELNLNRKEFTLRKPVATALVSTGGWLRSEDYGGVSPGTIESKFTWLIGAGTTGTYSIPFKNTTTSTSVFNLKYAKTVAAEDVGNLTVGTYATAVNNTPLTYPSLPVGNPLRVLTMSTNPTPIVDATPWTVDRFWFIDRSTAGAITGTLSFEYDNAIEGTLTAAYVFGEMKAQRYELTGATPGWHAPYPGQADNIVAGNVRVVNHPASYIDATYNIWAITHINALQAPLPLSVTNFTGKQIDNRVKLWWDVQSESDVKNYAIERTADLSFYELVGNKAPVGPSNSILNYDMWDNSPMNGMNYYRLASSNTDGSVKYYGPISVNFGTKGMFDITNVTAGNTASSIKVDFTYDSSLPYSYMVTDLLGNVVAKGDNNNALEGENSIVIPLQLSKGIYVISLLNREKVVSQKLVY